MTEYDYSPDAYERFQAKMAGVGSWVTEQRHHAPKYSNPFVPEQQASPSASRSRTPSRPESSSRHHQDRPQPSRSRTLPTPAPTPAGHGHTSRAYAYAQHGPGDPSSRHRTARSPQRSGSLPVDPRYASATHIAAPVPVAAHQVVPRTSPVAYAPPPPPGYRTRQVEYNYQPGQPIVLPPPRPGETYVIIPPKGGRVDVVPDSRSHSRSHSMSQSTSRSSGSKSSSPTKKGNNEALLKRLLTNLTPNVEWGNSSSRSRTSGRTLTREPGRRRSTSR
ncbi:hypothetical protein C8Q77DRAFT_1147181 [Trametes polyzona]|nr:hypothetical protein C8Q77DRAFT_1147181 [Trametes polyzona]